LAKKLTVAHLAQPNAFIPAEMLKEDGVIAQLYGKISSTPAMPSRSNMQDAVTLYDWANEYQQTGTSFRLGNSVRTGTNTSVNQNLEHARAQSKQINRERKEMKDRRTLEAAGSVNVHIHMYKWSFEAGHSSNKTKMTKVVSHPSWLWRCLVDISLIVRLQILPLPSLMSH
jgi:hypothetical protein